MQVAQTVDGQPVPAAATAPPQAICPYCGGVLTLRSRKRMNNGGISYFWRHQNNENRQCRARHKPHHA